MKMEQEKVRMDQEKFAKMNQSASNPNMPRDTVETLKQIQVCYSLLYSVNYFSILFYVNGSKSAR